MDSIPEELREKSDLTFREPGSASKTLGIQWSTEQDWRSWAARWLCLQEDYHSCYSEDLRPPWLVCASHALCQILHSTNLADGSRLGWASHSRHTEALQRLDKWTSLPQWTPRAEKTGAARVFSPVSTTPWLLRHQPSLLQSSHLRENPTQWCFHIHGNRGGQGQGHPKEDGRQQQISLGAHHPTPWAPGCSPSLSVTVHHCSQPEDPWRSDILLDWLLDRASVVEEATQEGRHLCQEQNLQDPAISTGRKVELRPDQGQSCRHGLSPSQLVKKDQWWKDPPWLQQHPKDWPTDQLLSSPRLPGIVMAVVLAAGIDLQFLEKFSSYKKAVRVLAYCLRWKSKRQPRLADSSRQAHPPSLSFWELCSVRLAILHHLQHLAWSLWVLPSQP